MHFDSTFDSSVQSGTTGIHFENQNKKWHLLLEVLFSLENK